MNEPQFTYATTCLRYILTTVGAIYVIKTVKDLLITYKQDILSNNVKKKNCKPSNESAISITGTNVIVNMKNGSDLNDNLSTRDFEGFADVMNEINPSSEPSTDEDFVPNILDEVDTTDNQLDMDDVVLADQDECSFYPGSDMNDQNDPTDKDAPANVPGHAGLTGSLTNNTLANSLLTGSALFGINGEQKTN